MTETANFDDAPIGSAPKGWTITMTGKGDPQWTVEKDDTAPSQANVLKQSGKATYPLALKDGTSIKNGFIAVKFKAISGSEDRAAGLVAVVGGEIVEEGSLASLGGQSRIATLRARLGRREADEAGAHDQRGGSGKAAQ